MANVALIETKPSRTDFKKEFDNAFDFADTQPWPQPEDALEEVYVNYPVEINR